MRAKKLKRRAASVVCRRQQQQRQWAGRHVGNVLQKGGGSRHSKCDAVHACADAHRRRCSRSTSHYGCSDAYCLQGRCAAQGSGGWYARGGEEFARHPQTQHPDKGDSPGCRTAAGFDSPWLLMGSRTAPACPLIDTKTVPLQSAAAETLGKRWRPCAHNRAAFRRCREMASRNRPTAPSTRTESAPSRPEWAKVVWYTQSVCHCCSTRSERTTHSARNQATHMHTTDSQS